jgi:hypothetical protein
MTDLLTDEERKQIAAARYLRATGKGLHAFADDLLAIIETRMTTSTMTSGTCGHGSTLTAFWLWPVTTPA